jgi:hypothetical protein
MSRSIVSERLAIVIISVVLVVMATARPCLSELLEEK